MLSLIQGVCLIEMKLLFTYIFEEKNQTVDFLNDRILKFNYSMLDKNNIPNSKLETSHIDKASFSLNASQILTLIFNIPLIFGDLFENKEYDNWKNFLRLN